VMKVNPAVKLYRYLTPSRVPGALTSRSVYMIQKEVLLQFLLNLLLAAFLIGLPGSVSMLSNPGWSVTLGFYYAITLLLVGLVLNRRLDYHLRAGLITAFFYTAGLVLLVRGGLGGAGSLLLLLSIVLATFLFEFTTGMVVYTISALAFAVVGRSMLRGEIALPGFSEILSSSNQSAWYAIGAVFMISGLILVFAGWINNRGVVRSLDSQQRLTRQSEDEREALEKKMQVNAAEARRRISQFEIASQIARDISSESNLEPLLQNAVNLIRDRFGYYHAGIFLNDEVNEYAILRAATGEAGRQLLESNHRLKIGETSIVGYVAGRGEARISDDVGTDNVHFKNPLLPETHSEIALPLISGGVTIGALDVQSINENAFSEEDIRILRTVADQLAAAVVKARLVEQMQKNLEELEFSQQQATRQVWQTHLRSARRKFAYRYRDARLYPDAPETPQAKEAVESGQPVVKIVQSERAGQEKSFITLAVPIKIRNQVLGVVDIEFETASVSPDLIALIESTVSRLAVSLENARLLEEIQHRAERERLVSEITSKVRASSDVDNIMRIAAQELGRSLGVSEVMVQLRHTGQ
jgi:GAF domain-containing protein